LLLPASEPDFLPPDLCVPESDILSLPPALGAVRMVRPEDIAARSQSLFGVSDAEGDPPGHTDFLSFLLFLSFAPAALLCLFFTLPSA
jgi:hypothetical protein